MRKFRVLIADDEERIIHFLSAKLGVSGYEILTASNGVEALEQIQSQEPDLIVLDVMMPKMDGFETLKNLRTFSSIPVIILSAKGTDADKIKGLDLGADDYLAKPFNPDELISRIEAIKRRLISPEMRTTFEVFSAGDLTIDFKKRSVVVNGEKVNLTRIEWLLLGELVQNVGNLVFYEDLLTHVWGSEYRDDIQILRTWISRLRYKITQGSSQPQLIRTIPKAGYIIDHPSE
jgi:two-component system KDP operon response regulator KdpE